MKRLIVVGAAVLLAGCAQWNTMTPQQQQLVIGTAVVGLVVGYHANDGDTFVVGPEPKCYDRHCKD